MLAELKTSTPKQLTDKIATVRSKATREGDKFKVTESL